MTILGRLKSLLTGSEGSYRGPAIGWSHWGNPFSISIGDGFQNGLTLSSTEAQRIPAVYACVMAIARAISMCYPKHIIVDPTTKKRAESMSSPAAVVMNKPNSYETWPQFILNAIASMMFYGESFVVLVRDDRGAITAMHLLPPRSCSPYVESTTGAIYYSIGANPMDIKGTSAMAPARDIMHLRRYTPRHPLIGESDLTAAALAMGINVSLSGNQAAFFSQMSRPSGILSTEQTITKDQMLQLRAAFEEQSKGMNAGKIPVLSNGLKFQQLSVSSQDAQVIEVQRMTMEDIARVFGVPLPVIGDLSHATMANVEATINYWLATGLGSILENIERSFDAAFGLSPNEYIEFDTIALLRVDFTARVNGLTKGVQGGLLSPNEAREREGLQPVDGGDTVFLQKQMVSIDMLADIQAAELAAARNAAKPAPVTQPAPVALVDPEDSATAEEDKAIVLDLFKRKRA